jgi:guanylate kinase
MQPGQVIIISGPSGVGKSSVVQRLVQRCPLPLELSVSATTRGPRMGELHGRDYFFISREEFQRHREHDDFLECAEVYSRGDWYGTLREPVTSGLREGKWIILEIDVEGAQQVLQHFPKAITVFIHPGSPQELERRLRGRKTESEDAIQRRLDVARRELSFADNYRFVVINDQLDDAVNKLCEILKSCGEPADV